MKKITLKITTFLLLTMFALQVQGQIVEGTLYSMRNVKTGNYMLPGDTGAPFTPTPSYTDASQNFKFIATTYQGQSVFNIVSSSFDGSMRGAGSGADWKIFNTSVTAPTADGSHGDKVWLLIEVPGAPPGGMFYRFTNRTGSRFLYEDDNSPVSGLEYITAEDGTTDNSLWYLEPASVLSSEEFDTSSLFISNPVKNQLSIKGLPSNVKQVSVYSLLGQEVLTRNVEAQSSLTLDVSALKSGIYLVEMKGDIGTFTKKIVKY